MWISPRFAITYSLLFCAILLISPERVNFAHSRILEQTDSAAKASNEDQQDYAASPLTAGSIVERELSGDREDSYVITLDAGQYIRLVVNQFGIDVGLRLYDPEGRILSRTEFRHPRTIPLSSIAQTAGIHRLEVYSLETAQVSGRYEVKIEEIKPATEKERLRVAGRQAFIEAEGLQNSCRKESCLEAIKKYDIARSYWELAGSRQEEASALENIGEIYHLMGEPQKSLRYFDQALRLNQAAGDRLREIDTLNQIARIHIELGNGQETVQYCNKALSMSQALAYRWGEAEALYNKGEFSYYNGDLKKSLQFYKQALSIWNELRNRRGQANLLMVLGYCHMDLGEMQEAFNSYEQALALWTAVEDRHGQSMALAALGHFYSGTGEKQRALDSYNQAIATSGDLMDHLGKAMIIGGIGYVYAELGEEERALEYYEKAKQLYKAMGHRKGEAGHLIMIGSLYHSLGDNLKALRYFRQAQLLISKLGDQRMQSYWFGYVGDIYAALGNRIRALKYYNQSLSMNHEGGDRRGEAHTLNSIGRIHEVSHETEKALDCYNKALPLNKGTGDRFGESQTLSNLARIERDRGNLIEARGRIEESLKIIETLRAEVASHQLRTSYLASVHQQYEFYTDLLMRLHLRQPSEGFDALALQASERARARSLLDLLAESRNDISRGADPSLLDRERNLRRKLDVKEKARMSLLTGSPSKEELATADKEIEGLLAEYEDVKAEIRARSPHYAALTQPVPLGLREIQQQVLDPDTLLLEYSLGDTRSYLWAVTETSVTSYELPKRAEIEASARKVYELLTACQPVAGETETQYQTRVTRANAQYQPHVLRLSRMLLEPVASQLGSKRLVIVAEGALQYIPFAALSVPAIQGPGVRGQGAVTTRPPLIVEHEIISLPSASALAVLRQETFGRKAAPKAIAVFADPVFAKNDPRVKPSGNTKRSPGDESPEVAGLKRVLRDARLTRQGLDLPRLEYTAEEAGQIMAVAPEGESFEAIGFRASRATAESPDLSQYRIIHFATHSLLNSEHPELSGIVLSLVSEKGETQNGFLRLHDIYNLNLPAELVVLSACQTALGKDIRGEGLVGLTRGFMYAGAERVVASLWKVDDVATAQLMKLFYQGMLRDGLRPAGALRKAQVEMWKRKGWGSPYYWAAFVLQGEWK